MIATKTSYQPVNGEWVQWDANGDIPALTWTDAHGNQWRATAAYFFDSAAGAYSIPVQKWVKPFGTSEWIKDGYYSIVADQSKYRRLSTGSLLTWEEIESGPIPSAIDSLGNIVEPTGWVYNSKYFTISIGYNPYDLPVNINDWVYLEIADKEGLVFE